MNRIIPLDPGAQGAPVHDLHVALQVLLDHAAIRPGDEGARKELMATLEHDLQEGVYGEATKTVVSTFQEEHGIDASGVVDQRTADAINELLGAWGLLDQPAARGAAGGVVSGRVRGSSGPAPGIGIRAVHVADGGEVRLGEDTTDADGRYTIRYGPLAGVETITLRVDALDATGAVVVHSDAAPAQALTTVDLMLPATEAVTPSPALRGRVVLEHGLAAAGLTLRAYRHDFNADPVRLDETRTDDQGLYAFTWGGGQQPPNVEIRAVDGENEVALTSLVGLAGDGAAPINLVAPAALQALPSEFQRLSDAIAPQVGDLSNLKSAREDDQRQDLSVLSEATGWDARLVALAANASSVADPDVGLSPKALYGLFRSGLPHDGVQLALTHPDTVGRALDAARTAGIVDLSNDELAQSKTAFDGYALKVRRGLPTPGSGSTYDALIASTPLAADQHDTFARAVLFHEGDAASLWKSVADAGLGEQVPALQLHGKLAFLTVNNPDLTAHLQQNVRLADPGNSWPRTSISPRRGSRRSATSQAATTRSSRPSFPLPTRATRRPIGSPPTPRIWLGRSGSATRRRSSAGSSPPTTPTSSSSATRESRRRRSCSRPCRKGSSLARPPSTPSSTRIPTCSTASRTPTARRPAPRRARPSRLPTLAEQRVDDGPAQGRAALGPRRRVDLPRRLPRPLRNGASVRGGGARPPPFAADQRRDDEPLLDREGPGEHAAGRGADAAGRRPRGRAKGACPPLSDARVAVRVA